MFNDSDAIATALAAFWTPVELPVELFPKQLSADGVLAVLIEGPVTEGHRPAPSAFAKLL